MGIWIKWIEEDKKDFGVVRIFEELFSWVNVKCELNLLCWFVKHIVVFYLFIEMVMDIWKLMVFFLFFGNKEIYGGEVIKVGIDYGIFCGNNFVRFLVKNNYKELFDIFSFDNYCDVFGCDFFFYV